MRIVLVACLVMLCLFTGMLHAATSSGTNWTVQRYDKSRWLVGVDREEVDPSTQKNSLTETAPQMDAVGNRQFGFDGHFEKSEVLVIDPPDNFDGVAKRLGFTVLQRVALRSLSANVYRLRVPQVATVPESINRLRGRFPGLTIDANHLFHSSAVPGSAETFAQQLIGWSEATATCGRGIRLGMIDGAVDLKHPALAGQHIDYRSFHNTSRKPGSAEHGTAIAAMLVGKAAWGGLLPAARLTAANVFEISGAGRASTNAISLLMAIDWMASEHVHVVNLSIAGADNEAVHQLIDKAREQGLVLVAAAGNWGKKGRPAYPAAYKDVIAITAVGIDRTVYAQANRGRYIDFAAPGVRIWTAVPGGGRFQSGTSFAAPFVSVLIALEVARGKNSSINAIRQVLRRHTVDLGMPGRDEVFGWGLVGMQRDCSR